MKRRHLLAAGAGLAAALPTVLAAEQRTGGPEPARRRMLSAADFGAVGDGTTDDTKALQAALDAAFQGDRGYFLTIPPGDYRVTRALRVALEGKPRGNVTRPAGIIAHGARLVSDIADGQNVFDIVSRAVVRLLLIEGLAIQGKGREGHGLAFDCNAEGSYIYNSCLRDVVVQGCGGDGVNMVGNIFESQIFNSYFRDNKGNGALFSHGPKGGVLSAIHVFGCVFGQNGNDGVALARGAMDVSFHGCYFLLERQVRPVGAERLHAPVQLRLREQSSKRAGFRARRRRHPAAAIRHADRLHRLFDLPPDPSGARLRHRPA